jgi:ABC-type uncharacterized transport system YnjBCD ATPase subunit
VFFGHVRLVALSFPQGKIGMLFQKYLLLVFLKVFKNNLLGLGVS